MKETIRRMAAILITVCMLVSCMSFTAFAENEPATPTDLAPVEEEKQEEPGEEDPVEGDTQEEPGKEEPAEDETAGGEMADGDPAGEDGNGAGTEGAKDELPELHYGQNGLHGTLKAGQEYKAILCPEYSWNILVTQELIPRAGQAVSSTGVQISFDGEKKELTQIDNEDPESTGVSLQFGVYAAKEKEHTISITIPFDADFILTAVKRPKQETEQEDEEEAGDSEETESGEDGEEPAGETGEEETGTPATEEEPADGEGTGDGDEKPDGETEEEPVVPEDNGELEEQADGEETEGGEESVIVTGEEGVGTIDLAKKLIKYMQSTDSNFVNRQVAKVSGKGLNDKDLQSLFEKIKGGAIIIESARGMKKSTVQKLIKILDSENLGVLAVLEDTSEGMDKIVGTLPKLGELFNVRIDLKALDDKALVNYACEYALSQEHTIDEYALLALHTRIAEMQTSTHQVSVSEVRDLVDDAIYYADKKNPAHLFDIILHKRYDDEDMIILREKDFMHY